MEGVAVVEHDRRHFQSAVVKEVVVAAAAERLPVPDEGVVAAVHAPQVQAIYGPGEVDDDIVEVAGQGIRRGHDVERAARLVEILADHVAVDGRQSVPGPLQVRFDVGHGAHELRNPQEPDRPAGGRDRPRVHQALEGPGDFHHPGAAAPIVVGAGQGMAEVPDDHDLFFGLGEAPERGGERFDLGLEELGFDLGLDHDLAALVEHPLQGGALVLADIEPEPEFVALLPARPKGRVPDHLGIAGPDVGSKIGDDSGRASLLAGLAHDFAARPRGKDDLAPDILALVRFLPCSPTHVHEFGLDTARTAVFDQSQGDFFVGTEALAARLDHPELSPLGPPADGRRVSVVANRAVGRPALDNGVCIAHALKLSLDPDGGIVPALVGLDPVELRNADGVPEGDLSRDLIHDGPDGLRRGQGLFCPDRNQARPQDKNYQGNHGQKVLSDHFFLLIIRLVRPNIFPSEYYCQRNQVVRPTNLLAFRIVYI